MLGDGVHLNDIGLDIFTSGLQDAIKRVVFILIGGGRSSLLAYTNSLWQEESPAQQTNDHLLNINRRAHHRRGWLAHEMGRNSGNRLSLLYIVNLIKLWPTPASAQDYLCCIIF